MSDSFMSHGMTVFMLSCLIAAAVQLLLRQPSSAGHIHRHMSEDVCVREASILLPVSEMMGLRTFPVERWL